MRTVKHTGALILWVNQPYHITGNYAQCEVAIDDAQRHCCLVGWWSLGSLVWNPISLATNARARKALRRQAHQACDYVRWWTTYYGGGPHLAVWTPPPVRPAHTKWWMWLALIVIPSFVALIVTLAITSDGSHSRHTPPMNQPLPTLTLPTFAPPPSP